MAHNGRNTGNPEVTRLLQGRSHQDVLAHVESILTSDHARSKPVNDTVAGHLARTLRAIDARARRWSARTRVRHVAHIEPTPFGRCVECGAALQHRSGSGRQKIRCGECWHPQ